MKVKLDREDSVVSETNGNTVCGEAGKDGCVTVGNGGCATVGNEGCVTADKEGCVTAYSDNGCVGMDICDKESGEYANGAGDSVKGWFWIALLV